MQLRLTGRLFRRRPQESQILLVDGHDLLAADRGLAPRALRDIEAATAAGRFTVDDPRLALAVAAALCWASASYCQQPERDDAEAADRVTEDVLRLFGLPADEAREICRRPLPGLDKATLPDPRRTDGSADEDQRHGRSHWQSPVMSWSSVDHPRRGVIDRRGRAFRTSAIRSTASPPISLAMNKPSAPAMA